jgi:putative N6-adenine-specific DNA methylase
LPIEAAFIAQNIPPGKFRKGYAFENWPDYDQELFEKVKKEYSKKEFNHKIYASDISGSNLLNAQTNARRALVYNKIHFQKIDFKDLDINPSEKTILLINPPYGERIKTDDIEQLYTMIGERLKHHYAGCTAWILSASFTSIHKIALKPARKLELFNGSLKCKYNMYQLFSGKLSQQLNSMKNKE